VAADRPAATRRTYVDTADWRLHSTGWTLDIEHDAFDHVRAGPIVMITLRDRQSEAVLASYPGSADPRFAADLPSIPPWDRVSATIEDRRLLSQLDLETRLQQAALLNSDAKTTTRLIVARHSVRDELSGRRHSVRRVTVTAVRGYETTGARVGDALTEMGLHPWEGDLLSWALAAAGRPAPGAGLGPGVALERSAAAGHAVAAVLARLRSHVIANEQGVREQLDVEFLHDYRVAIRRARSIVKQAQGVLPEQPRLSLADGLSWLAGQTGPPRDLDVHLLELGHAPRDELDPLRKYLTDQRQAVQYALLAAMDSDRYRELLQLWADLARGVEASLDVGLAGEFADEKISSAYKRVLRRGRAIDELSPPEDLHSLRKRAKELRYLLECFQSLYPPDQRAAVVRELKALQDNLGEYQDCQVQAAALRAMGEQLVESRTAPASTLMAMGRLAEGLEVREARARDEFQARFERFASPANRKRVRAMVGAGEESGG
jgi:CHAD domain-containing protein